MNRCIVILSVITSLLCGCGAFVSQGPSNGDMPAGQRKGEVVGKADATVPAAGKEDRKEHK